MDTNKLLDTTAVEEIKKYTDTKVAENASERTFTIVDDGSGNSYNLIPSVSLETNAEAINGIIDEIEAGHIPIVYVLTPRAAGTKYGAISLRYPATVRVATSSSETTCYLSFNATENDSGTRQYYGLKHKYQYHFELAVARDTSGTLSVPSYKQLTIYGLTDIQSAGLGQNNTMSYTPSGDYNPATKKYVDDSIAAIPAPDLTAYATKDYVDSESVTFKPLPEEVPTKDVTTEEFIEAIKALNLTAGMAYLQHVELTDLPAELSGGEVEVYIYPWNVIYCVLRSADRPPYMWELNSFENRGWESLSCQAYTLPEASENNLNVIKQYVGETTEEFTSGYYYQVIEELSTDESGAEITTYKWENINVQPSSEVDTSNFYTKAEVDALIGDINAVLATLTTVVADEEEY